jgi:N-terminal 7TM region of histidine kinase
MKLLDLAPLFGALCNFVLAVFVLWQDRKSRLNQVFFLWGICITIWNIGTFALFLRPSPAIAYEWARFLQMGVIFIPCTLLHLSLLIANIERPRIITSLYALGGLLALSNLCGYFISNVRSVGYAYYSVAGPGFWIFACTFSLTGVSIAVLLWKRRELPPMRRKRLNGMIAAQTLLVALGTNDILPILGIDHYPFTDRASDIASCNIRFSTCRSPWDDLPRISSGSFSSRPSP